VVERACLANVLFLKHNRQDPFNFSKKGTLEHCIFINDLPTYVMEH